MQQCKTFRDSSSKQNNNNGVRATERVPYAGGSGGMSPPPLREMFERNGVK